MSNVLPSRFQIGDEVKAGRLNGGDLAQVKAVKFSEFKVSYDVLFLDGKKKGLTRNLLSERVHDK